MKRVLIVFFILISFISPSRAMAFSETTSGGHLLAEIFPQNPKPSETIRIDLTSYQMNLGTAKISWSVNGNLKNEGIGLSRFQTTAGKAGGELVVEITATNQNQTINKTIKIVPQEIDIIWEAAAYVPPFYKGKVLPSADSEITVAAMGKIVKTDGTAVPFKELNFEWYKEFKKIGGGLGISSILVETDQFKNREEIKVVVSNLSKTLVAENKIAINKTPIIPNFYLDRPLEGPIYSETLKDSFQLKDEENTIRVEPFFAPLSSYQKLQYFWAQNNEASEAGEPKLTIARKSADSGKSNITVSIKNPDDMLLKIKKTIVIEFGVEQIKF